MQHSELEVFNRESSRKIIKPRIIAGFIAEMDAANVVLLISSKTDDFRTSARLICEFKVPFQSSTIKIADAVLEPSTYKATALFAGQRIEFNLEVKTIEGDCSFPEFLDIFDLRISKRRKFSPEVQLVEISTRGSTILAVPIDLSQNSLAVISVSSMIDCVRGEFVEIKIRGDTTFRDVFSFQMKVKEIQPSSGIVRLLFEFGDSISGVRYRKSSRQNIAGISVSIWPLDDQIGAEITCRVTDVSLTGCQCEIMNELSDRWIVPGLHVNLYDKQVHATVVWVHGRSFGLRLDALDDAETLTRWYQVLGKIRPHNNVQQSQLEDLVGLLTQTGLLKGSRRKVFGTTPSKFLPPERVFNNPLLFHRLASINDAGRIYSQLSMVRMTDNFWCMQEGAHTGEAGVTYRDLFRDIPLLARDLYFSTTLAPRYVGGIYHHSVKSSGDFVDEFLKDSANSLYEVLLVSIKSQMTTDPVVNFSARELSRLSAKERLSVMNEFNPILFDVFGGGNGAHSRLNAELASSGPAHKAQTLVVQEKNTVLALAYRLKSYYALSSTGVVNSLFLIVKNSLDLKKLQSIVEVLTQAGFASGTDDLTIVFDSTRESQIDLIALLPDARRFSLYVIDCELNKELLGARSEPEDPTNLRISAKG